MDWLKLAKLLDCKRTAQLLWPALMNAVAIFVDGTWNTAASPFPTNVVLLSEWTQSTSSQVRTYIDGVGLEYHGIRKILAGGTGYGTRARIIEAYLTLCEGHRWGKIFLFGFSRGAFAVRSLMGFADAVGLRLENRLDRVSEAYDLYLAGGSDPDDPGLQRFVGNVAGDDRRPTDETGTQLPIWFVGVWDTVGMLGIPWLTNHWTRRHRIELPRNVSHARQALAIHELRRHYPPALWRGLHPDAKHQQTLKQVWFPGAHADVGGGYERRGSAVARLCDAPLEWIAAEAETVPLLGLDLKKDWRLDLADRVGTSRVHSQMRGLFAKLFGATRDELAAWQRLSPKTLETCRLHQGYLDQLVNGNPPVCLHDTWTRQRLDAAACAAFQMHVGLLYQRENQEVPPWLKDVTMQEINGVRTRAEAFLRHFEGDSVPDLQGFERALLLWRVAQPAESVPVIRGLIEKLGESLSKGFPKLPYPPFDEEQRRQFDAYQRWRTHVQGIIEGMRLVARRLPPSFQSAHLTDLATAFAQFLKIGDVVVAEDVKGRVIHLTGKAAVS